MNKGIRLMVAIILAALGLLSLAAFREQLFMAGDPRIGRQMAGAQAEARPSSASIVTDSVLVTNARDQGFTVSWLTTASVTGAIRYGLSPDSLSSTAYDDRGNSFTGRTHHVSLDGLLPDTWYYYDILSGNEVDDNGGIHYIYATGPTLGTSLPAQQLWGRVVTGTGEVLSRSLVYAILRDTDSQGSSRESAPLSTWADPNGIWNFNTSSFREGDLEAYFTYISNTDQISMTVLGEPDGAGQDAFTPAQADASLGVSRTITVTAGITLPIPPPPPPVSGAAPDLVVTQIASGTPLAGCPFIVTIENKGNATATVPFRVALYLDHSRVPYPGERSNINTYWVVTEDLAAGSSRQLTVVINQLLPQGNHTLYAQVDSYNNQVRETDEENNIFGPVQVQARIGCKQIYLPLVLRNYH